MTALILTEAAQCMRLNCKGNSNQHFLPSLRLQCLATRGAAQRFGIRSIIIGQCQYRWLARSVTPPSALISWLQIEKKAGATGRLVREEVNKKLSIAGNLLLAGSAALLMPSSPPQIGGDLSSITPRHPKTFWLVERLDRRDRMP